MSLLILDGSNVGDFITNKLVLVHYTKKYRGTKLKENIM